MAKTRILLVEDEPLWQQGIVALLDSASDFDIVGVTDHYDAALALFQAEQPEIALLDWKIKGNRDGLAVAAALVEQGLPPERIVLVTGSERSLIPPHPYRYVPKSRIASDLVDCIREALLESGLLS